MGVPVNNPGSNRENCPKISTACVIWQGPNIPCIDLCAGDAIDEVVFKLATYLCELSKNIFNIDNVDFTCMLPPDIPREDIPTNLEQLIQYIISYTCDLAVGGSSARMASPLLAGARIVGTNSFSEPIIELPDGIAYFDEKGDYIKVLEQSKYIRVAATKLAETILVINTTQGRIFDAEKAIKNLENQFAKASKASTNDIYIVSQCASSGTPGQQILIQDAFTVFERNYCNLTSILGTTASLYRGVNSQIANLPNLPQLMNNSLQMKAIPRWSFPVNDIGSSMSNLWLTIGDMRSKIIQIANATFDVPCILLSPENMTVGTIGTISTEVYWEKPSVQDVQMPTSYSIQVYSVEDKEFKNPLYSQTTSEIEGKANVINIASENIVAGEEYVIQISCIYKCGMSKPSSLISQLLTTDVYFEVQASFKSLEPVPATCTDSEGITTNYDIEKKSLTFVLINLLTKSIIPNDKNIPITIIARFEINSCDFGETLYEDVTFEIQPGDTESNEYIYISNKLTNCIDGSCGPSIKNLFCGVFVSERSVQFDSKYRSCSN
jgi:hypothetical protein